ncbi:hypothetical protein ACJX0J_010572, partial [Zea mays]
MSASIKLLPVVGFYSVLFYHIGCDKIYFVTNYTKNGNSRLDEIYVDTDEGEQ